MKTIKNQHSTAIKLNKRGRKWFSIYAALVLIIALFCTVGMTAYAASNDPVDVVNTGILTYLMRNPIRDRSVEYNDNRLSLYCGQGGKCAISDQILEIGYMHCHHIVPRQKGGTDEYWNLSFVTDTVHRLIHATDENTIKSLLSKVNLDKKQLAKLNKLRRLAEIAEIA